MVVDVCHFFFICFLLLIVNILPFSMGLKAIFCYMPFHVTHITAATTTSSTTTTTTKKCEKKRSKQPHNNNQMNQIIICKNIDSLCVFMFKRIDSKNSADLRENKKRLKASHVYTSLWCYGIVCICLFSLLFFQMRWDKSERTIFVAAILYQQRMSKRKFIVVVVIILHCSHPSTLFSSFFLLKSKT